MNRKSLYARRRRSAQNGSHAQPNGFTLMELLIVIAIILILMLMAIPTIGSLKKKANETSAINSMKVITSGEIQYESSFRPTAMPARCRPWAATRLPARLRPPARRSCSRTWLPASSPATSSPSATAPR